LVKKSARRKDLADMPTPWKATEAAVQQKSLAPMPAPRKAAADMPAQRKAHPIPAPPKVSVKMPAPPMAPAVRAPIHKPSIVTASVEDSASRVDLQDSSTITVAALEDSDIWGPIPDDSAVITVAHESSPADVINRKIPEPPMAVQKVAGAARAAKEKPEFDPTIGIMYRRLMKRATGYFFSGRFRKAIRLLQRAVRIDRFDSQAQLMLGTALYEVFKSWQAVRNLRRAVQLNPNLSESYLFLASAYQMLGKNQRARRALRRYLKRDPRGHYTPDVRKIIRKL